MRDYLTIGSTPPNEECAQVGQSDYPEQSRKECIAYINQLRRKLGPEPEGAALCIKSFSHDFGSYREVVCHYDDTLPASIEYAFNAEGNGPLNWDAAAKQELGVQ